MTTATEPNPNTPRTEVLASQRQAAERLAVLASQRQSAQRLALISKAGRAAEAPAVVSGDRRRSDVRAAEQAARDASAAVDASLATPAPGVRRVTSRELESSLEAFFNKQVRMMGGIPVKLAPTQKGVPDRLVLLPGGRIALVELKTSTGRLSSAQQLWHYRASELGTQVAVLAGRADILAWMREQFPKDIPAREARALAAAAHPRKTKSTEAQA